jgi:hypothetical protein
MSSVSVNVNENHFFNEDCYLRTVLTFQRNLLPSLSLLIEEADFSEMLLHLC